MYGMGVTAMAEYIKQKIQGGKKSICDSCTHRNVCKAIDNHCTECNHYQCTADVEPVQQWIPVTERLPETCVAVLARCFYHGKWRTLVCHTSKRNDGEWYTNEIGQWVPVTHWMPIPLPKGE